MSHSAYIKSHNSMFVYVTPGISLTKKKFKRHSLDNCNLSEIQHFMDFGSVITLQHLLFHICGCDWLDIE